jgi:outer membrane protein assembly factor BamB
MGVLAVVPIFMSAGVAVLPALVASATGVAAVILKPRELLRVCRERPGVVAIAAGVVVGLSFGAWWLLSDSSARAARTASPRTAVQYDWAKVAEDIIAQEKIRALARSDHGTATQSGGAPAPMPGGDAPGVALVLGRDFSRCGYDGGVSPLQLLAMWSFRPEDTMFFSVPVVKGKRVWVAGCTADLKYIGLLACLDADTGKPIWQKADVNGDVLKPFYSSPALTADGKYLITGGGLHEDRDCSLRCFDADTGEQRWEVKTALHIESSPAILGDLAVVGCGAIEGSDGKAIGDPGHVLAVRISDGKELWRQPVNDSESSPAIDEEGTVFIGSGFNGNAVVALRSASDDQLRQKHLERIAWRTPVDQPVTSAITLAGDLVIAGAGNSDFVYANPHPRGFVVALERKTGKIRWQVPFADAVLSAIAFRDGKLICPVRTGEVAALDVTDGRVLWRRAVSGKAPILAGCAFTGKMVYAVSDDGNLAVIDPKDGNIVEKIYLNDQARAGEGKCFCAPQVVNGRVIVGSETGGMRCYVGARNAQ